MLDELISQKMTDQGGNQLAMMVYPAGTWTWARAQALAGNGAGWGMGNQVTRKLDDVFRGWRWASVSGHGVEALGQFGFIVVS